MYIYYSTIAGIVKGDGDFFVPAEAIGHYTLKTTRKNGIMNAEGNFFGRNSGRTVKGENVK